MPNEPLAVVDELDRIIAYRPRREIHALSLRHRAVHILVFNRDGQLLLQKRSRNKDLNQGLWDSSAAGHVDQGEDYADCAPRELREELGIDAALTDLFKLEACPELGMEFIRVYQCRHDGPFSFAAEEIDELQWLRLDEVDNRVNGDDAALTETFKIIWRHYRTLHG
ncbi:NUDIX domain-containing protein [Methylomonas sp. SURF-2]|uniref:NUDIX domain-containing protein n=1 Tax=Methylomonas subterranea TaxID=2952225 RepID=A0ABT1TJT3_9GAMM|nr:NUDIX domain-containing protein [Methylomonas sp. SURF-2]MCQ8105725.1 NUDIX domain-containing protein [Methylomonas sp. SURF-2]